MSELVAYYDENPADLKGDVEIQQFPIASAARARSTEGAVRKLLVYVRVPSEAGPFLVPFGEYDDWSLRDRYNEAIQKRIENGGFDFRHAGAGSAPRDPRPLRWPDEPGFSAAVTSVLENAATEVVINIRSNRTYGIDGSLGVMLRKSGFDLGGGTQRSAATSLHISASFPQARKAWR